MPPSGLALFELVRIFTWKRCYGNDCTH